MRTGAGHSPVTHFPIPFFLYPNPSPIGESLHCRCFLVGVRMVGWGDFVSWFNPVSASGVFWSRSGGARIGFWRSCFKEGGREGGRENLCNL